MIPLAYSEKQRIAGRFSYLKKKKKSNRQAELRGKDADGATLSWEAVSGAHLFLSWLCVPVLKWGTEVGAVTHKRFPKTQVEQRPKGTENRKQKIKQGTLICSPLTPHTLSSSSKHLNGLGEGHGRRGREGEVGRHEGGGYGWDTKWIHYNKWKINKRKKNVWHSYGLRATLWPATTIWMKAGRWNVIWKQILVDRWCPPWKPHYIKMNVTVCRVSVGSVWWNSF